VKINEPDGDLGTTKKSDQILDVTGSDQLDDPTSNSPAHLALVSVEGGEPHAIEDDTVKAVVTFLDATLESQTIIDHARTPKLPSARTESTQITAIPLVGVEGALYQGKVAALINTDPNLQYTDFTATIDWGDGATTTGIVEPDLSVEGSHTYVRFGQYSLRVTVQVRGGVGNSSVEQATILNAPFTATGVTLASETMNVTGAVASFRDSNPFASAADFAAEIHWGDGQSSIGTVVASGSFFKVFGSHDYEKKGKFKVSVIISDLARATSTATSFITIRPPGRGK